MTRTVLGAVLCAALAAGCFELAEESAFDRWGENPDLIGARRKQGRDLTAAWQGKADPWAGFKGTPSNVIGGRSALDGKRAAAVAAASSPAVPGSRGAPALSREVQVLAARVDRLERAVSSKGAPAAVSRPAPVRAASTVAIYKVHPDGQVAWIAAGSSSGMRKGQALQVVRSGKAVAQVQVSRVWPGVSELAVVWANGKLQRGDSVVTQ